MLLENSVSRGVSSLITSIFLSLYFLKWCPIFDTSSLTQFSKFNSLLWACWFLGKYLFNFVHPTSKLHNQYCHNVAHPLLMALKYFGSGCQNRTVRHGFSFLLRNGRNISRIFCFITYSWLSYSRANGNISIWFSPLLWANFRKMVYPFLGES